ncbi:MAG TPA: SAF domain-containing protein [Marmoricola sp.]
MTTLPSATSAPVAGSDPHGLASPGATRARAAGWRDPRLALGVAIVAVCVLLGATVLGGADDTVPVWSAARDLPAGSDVGADDLRLERVRLSEGAAARYLEASEGLAAGTTVTRDVAAGELLPRSALGADGGTALVEVPLSVAPDGVPGSVARGTVVDVWVTPAVPVAGDVRPRARLALDDVVVVAVPEGGDGLAPESTRQVIVGVEEDHADDLAEALGLVADGRVVLTRQAAR